MLKCLHVFGNEVKIGDSTASEIELHNLFLGTFGKSKKRWEDSLFTQLTPPGGDLSDTWDFELEIDTLRIPNDHTAQVKAWIYFVASPPDTTTEWQFGKKHRETIMFKKEDGEWRIKNVKKLFMVLSKFK